ncbi:hypothetical protein SOVF_159600 [Spinacia oleracea]|nr:hypothetical protein SOVF_159600 [Spinacia oleracea]
MISSLLRRRILIRLRHRLELALRPKNLGLTHPLHLIPVSPRIYTPRLRAVPSEVIAGMRDWFRDYKIPHGKLANIFGLGNKAASKDYSLKVITETNESWDKLVKRNIDARELSLV